MPHLSNYGIIGLKKTTKVIKIQILQLKWAWTTRGHLKGVDGRHYFCWNSYTATILNTMHACLYIKYTYVFMHIHINLFRGNHIVCSCITEQDISMHCSIFYILITLPNRFGGTDVLCSLTPWTDLPIWQTGVHSWAFKAEKFLRILHGNPPGACRWNLETLILKTASQNPHVYLCKDKIHPLSDGDRNWDNKYPSRHKSLMDPLEKV